MKPVVWLLTACAALGACAGVTGHKTSAGSAVVYPGDASCPPILSDFGASTNSLGKWRRAKHRGVDILEEEGYPVLAVDDGEVILTGVQAYGGLRTILRHTHGDGAFFTIYYHLSKAAVKDGDRVKRGDVVGEIGLSGSRSGDHNHLHFEVWKSANGFYTIQQLSADVSPTARFDAAHLVNPHDLWIDGNGDGPPIGITPFIEGRTYDTNGERRFTYPVPCR